MSVLLLAITVEPLTMDSPYCEKLHNADKMAQSLIIPHGLLYIATSVQRKPRSLL